MEFIIHETESHWGKNFQIVTKDGLGTVTISFEPHPCWGETVTLSNLSVYYTARGYGYGRALIKEAERIAIERNAKKITLICDKNKDNIYEMYKRYGYVEVGPYHRYNGYNEVYMEKKLQEKDKKFTPFSVNINGSVFKFNEKQQRKIEKFKKEHFECACSNPSDKESTFSYEFTPTGIGVSVKIKCEICGESEDITNYKSW